MKRFSGIAPFTVALLLAVPTFVRAQQYVPVDLDGVFDDEDEDFSSVKGVNLLSNGRQIAGSVRRAMTNGSLVVTGPLSLPKFSDGRGPVHSAGPNVQANDPGLDHIASFPGFTRPFEFSTQSETSIVRSGNNVVVGYNTSAGEFVIRIGNGLFATQVLLSGFSVSHDGGKTFRSGFVTPPAGSVLTFGDPALAVDRNGNFYFSHLAGDPAGNTVVGVSKSTDTGETWSNTVIAFTDNGADKNWMAVGPDPTNMGRDNVYVTWTRFTATSSELVLSRSIDGGASFSTKTLFAPAGDSFFSNQIQFSNPVVDRSTGRLYIPFLHFSQFDADAIRVLVSDDGGVTFRFLAFNQAGAPDAFAWMNVTPGAFTDCGANNGGFRNVLHQGPNLGGGRFGFPRYRHATRLVTQPAAAAANGRFFLAFQTNGSPFFGDDSAGSSITALYSRDGGNSWFPPLTVAPSTAADPQHVHPAVTLTEEDGGQLLIGYYVQQADSKLRTDVATTVATGKGLKLVKTGHLSSTSFDLTPSNNPFPIVGNPFFTTNYDRAIRACYDIGEYMSLTRGGDEGGIAAWGDNRNTWIGPPDSIQPGPHAQPDVFVTQTGD